MFATVFLFFLLVVLLTINEAKQQSVSSQIQILEQRVEKLFADVSKLPISAKNKSKKIEVRFTFDDDNVMTSTAEAQVMGKHPNEFRSFFENHMDAFKETNPMIHFTQALEDNDDDEENRQPVKSVLNFPFPLAQRVMVHWAYNRIDRTPGLEHMLIFSEEGNERILRENLTDQELRKYVLARTFLCVFWVKPIEDDTNGEIKGSCIRYAFSGDTGGAIPTWIQNKVGPKTAMDSISGFIEYCNKPIVK